MPDNSAHPDDHSSRPVALLVANTDWYLYNFRKDLIQQVHDAGWQVVLACTNDEYAAKLRAMGWTVETVDFPGGDLSLAREARALYQLRQLIWRHRPAVVHLFTLKCVLYGMLAGVSTRSRPRYIGAITGLGYLFTNGERRTRLIRGLVMGTLVQALRRNDAHLVFQNTQDYDEFAHALPPERMHVIRGSGVDADTFRPPEPPRTYRNPLVVTYCGRLIAEKGINDFLEAVEIARARGAAINSRVAGAPFPGNPSSISQDRLARLKQEDRHVFLGHTADMPTLFSASDIVVLPTYYREGTPKTLLEAAAAGCILITTTIPACDGIVDEGLNGYRVPPRAPHDIAERLLRLSEASADALSAMSAQSRTIAETRFEVNAVNRQTLALYPPVEPS